MIAAIVKALVSSRFVCNGRRWYYEIIFLVKVVLKKRHNSKSLSKFTAKACNFFSFGLFESKQSHGGFRFLFNPVRKLGKIENKQGLKLIKKSVSNFEF